jgi:hypothetical protein
VSSAVPNQTARWLYVFPAVAAALFAAGCVGDNLPPITVLPPLVLVPLRKTVSVKPGQTARATFALTAVSGMPVAGERLDFAAVDNPETPESELFGATLSASSGLTDAAGMASVTITGGLETLFKLRARNARAAVPAEVTVIVREGDDGNIAVVAVPAVGSNAAMTVSAVDLLLFDKMSCSMLSPIAPPSTVYLKQTVPPGAPGTFGVSNMGTWAVLGQGRDGDGQLRASGCVDVPGSTVVVGKTVNVYLPLSEVEPIPRGTFVLSSSFSLAKRELPRRVAAPWQDLGDCPLDPGQLWLDCAVDALGSPPGDALDCVPAASGEGDLANLITARRGNLSTGSACRAVAAATGAQGLDAKVAALFPSPAQAPISSIDTLGTAIAAMFDDVKLGSTLALEPTASVEIFQATHTLRSASFQVGAQATTVDIVALGTPNSQARFVPVSTKDGLLSVGSHGMGMRLGTLAHTAFAKVSLTGHGFPSATSAYLDVAFGLATTGTGAARKAGCDALDVVVCTDVGRPVGCLGAACVAGQAALAARLDAAFTLADGDGADLQLSGSAAMTDDNGDGFADRLGASSKDSGLWTAQIRAHAGTEIVSGSWSGLPQP